MKRLRVVLFCAAPLGAGAAACSFASLDYLQNGPPVDSGVDAPADIDVMSGDDSGTLDAHITPLATGQMSPNLLAQDSDNLYWISANDVMTVPKSNGSAHSLGQVSGVLELTTDNDPSGSVYLVTGTNVVALKKQGGAMAAVFGVDAGLPAPTAIAVDDVSLFVLQYDATDSTTASIVRVPKGGGAPVTLPRDPSFPPQTLTLNSTDVLWGSTAATPSEFLQLSKTGASVPNALPITDESIMTPVFSRQLAANGSTLFWIDTGLLYARDLQASSPSSTLYTSSDDDEFPALVIDDTNVYVLNNFDMSVMRVSFDGKQSARLVKDLTLPTSLVVDATSVYVSVGPAASGQILKIDK